MLDTDICVEILRGNKKIRGKLEFLPEEVSIYTTYINLAKLYYGALLSSNPTQQKEKIKKLAENIKMFLYLTMTYS